MRLIFSPLAEKQFKKLPKTIQILIAQKVRRMRKRNYYGSSRMKGYKNVFKVRIGNYRIVYKKTANRIYVINLGHRKDVYRILKRLFK